MVAQAREKMTPAEYLELERQAEVRSQYLDGEVFAMAGASLEHNQIVGNLYFGLRSQLRSRGCDVFSSDLRVHIPATGLYTYPDLVVICGPAELMDGRDTLLNPRLIVEVLSPSTEAFDRGQKFAHYRSLASLSDYLLVAQEQVLVEHFSRQGEGRWLLAAAESLEDRLEIPTLGVELSLAEIYDRVPGLGADDASEPS